MELYLLLLLLAIACVVFSVSVDDGVLSGALLALAMGMVGLFRLDTGYDYATYYSMIRNDTVPEGVEPIMRTAFRLFHDLKLYWLGVSLFAALTIGILWYALRHSRTNAAFGLFIFLSVPVFYFASFSVIRQFLAISVLALAAIRAQRSGWVSAVVLCGAAVAIHKSSILFVLPVLAVRTTSRIYPMATYVAMILGAGTLSLFVGYLVDTLLPGYRYYLQQEGGDGRLLGLFFGGLCVLFLISKSRIPQSAARYFNLFFLGAIAYLALVGLNAAAARAGLYGLVFLCWLVPEVVGASRNGISVLSSVSIGSFAGLHMFYLYMVKDGGGLRVTPYTSIFAEAF